MFQITPPSEFIKCNDISDCFQVIYNFSFMILLTLAFIWFIYGVFQYLLSGAGVFAKEEGKKKMQASIIAIIVVLLIPSFLKLINPEIFTGIKLKIPKVTVEAPVLQIYAPETPPQDVLQPGEKVIDSPANVNLRKALQDKNIKYISKLEVDCKNLVMTIYGISQRSSQTQKDVVVAKVPIKTGETKRTTDRTYVGNCDNKNIPKSNTTPSGEFTLTNKRYNHKGIISTVTRANMGVRAITYDARRGLLIHGSATEDKDKRFFRTYGCIRMKNADLAAIFDYVQEGKTKLVIKDD